MHSTCTSVLVSFFLILVSGQQLDPSWNYDTGTISLKASLNPSLCVTSVPYNKEKTKAFLQLIDCSQQFPVYEGDIRFDLDAISSGVYRFRTPILPVGANYAEYAVYACFYAGTNQGSISLTDNCDRSNSWHYWSFPQVFSNQYQLKHQNTGKCMRTSQISNGTTLIAADCNTNDKNQIWNGEFLKQDGKWEPAGSVTLKPVSNPSLCMRTEQVDFKTSIINLASCEKKYDPYEGKGEKEFRLGTVPDGFYQMQTVHVPVGGVYGIYACLWAGVRNGSANNSPILTDDCNYNNSWHYWKFIEISQGRVQLVHKNTGKCFRATNDKSTVVAADCDRNDVNQLWIKESL